MPINLPTPPGSQDVLDAQTGRKMDSVWYRWIISLVTRLQLAPFVQKSVELTAQNASIGTTPIPRPTTTSGYYRANWYVRVTTPATTGAATSSILVTISWTEGGIALSKASTAQTGNTTSTYDQGVLVFKADQNTPINYATTYASNTANQMKYEVSILLEFIS